MVVVRRLDSAKCDKKIADVLIGRGRHSIVPPFLGWFGKKSTMKTEIIRANTNITYALRLAHSDCHHEV
jgi:hypothetical protein